MLWQYNQPGQIIFGNGESKRLGALMRERNMKNALMIATPSAVKSSLAQTLIENAEGAVIDVISEVLPNPTVHNANACAAKAIEIEADCIVALGGGSALDCAKAAAAIAAQADTAEELLMGRKITKALPLIALPTTSGTASEVTAVSVLSWPEKGLKAPLNYPALFPALAIVDPELTYSCPKAVIACAGMDALSHALESLWNKNHRMATDAIAAQAVKLALDNLQEAYDTKSPSAMENMAQASLLAGMAFSQTGTAGIHACSYILTSKYGIPHGEACAFTMEAFCRLNIHADDHVMSFLRGVGIESLEALTGRITVLKLKFHMKMNLASANIPTTDLPEISRISANTAVMNNNPVKMSAQAIQEIFEGLN